MAMERPDRPGETIFEHIESEDAMEETVIHVEHELDQDDGEEVGEKGMSPISKISIKSRIPSAKRLRGHLGSNDEDLAIPPGNKRPQTGVGITEFLL